MSGNRVAFPGKPPTPTVVNPIAPAAVPRRANRWVAAELAAMGGCGLLAFTDLVPLASLRLALPVLPLLLLVWVCLRRRPELAYLHLLILAGFGCYGASTGSGVFALFAPAERFAALAGRLVAVAAFVRLLTWGVARRRRESAALAAAVAEYRDLVDDSPALICRYTPDGTLTFANDTLCKFLGRRPEEVVGGSILDFLPDLPGANAPSDLPARPGHDFQLSHVGPLRRADGAERWHRWIAHPAAGPDGAVQEYHAIGVDITDRKRADEQRRAVERKLLDTQRLESLGVMAGGIAHDFNNLLAGILGHAELAARPLPPGDPLREHLDPILAAARRAAELTRQLLAYSGKGKFVVRPVDLGDVIRQGEVFLRTSVPRKADLRFDLCDDLQPVAGDPTQLRQVVVNLVTNAGEALGDRPGVVTVAVRSADLGPDEVPESYLFEPLEPGRYVVLAVGDTGPGMDEATLARVFDPFFTTKFAGRGLGLAAVLGIVRGHKGGVRIDSRPGEGTRATVWLPAAAVGSGAATPSPPPVPFSAARDPDSGTRPDTAPASPAPDRGAVLVIDDEEPVRRVAGLMLRQLGYEVLVACDGQEGVEVFAAHAGSVRAVLLDLTMPRMDGAEALAAIRLLDPAIPVILCSGYTEDAIPEGLSRADITGFLQKPFSMSDLDRLLRTAAGNHPRA